MSVTIPVLEGKYKVIKHGSRGRVISIPESYAKANRIKPKTELNVYIQGDCLIIQPVNKDRSS